MEAGRACAYVCMSISGLCPSSSAAARTSPRSEALATMCVAAVCRSPWLVSRGRPAGGINRAGGWGVVPRSDRTAEVRGDDEVVVAPERPDAFALGALHVAMGAQDVPGADVDGDPA